MNLLHSSKTPPPTTRWHAIIPAAGLSRRMGTPKLLLPFRGSTLLGNLCGALQSAGVDSVGIVCRPGDLALQAEVRTLGFEPLIPATDPPDMRASVEFGLEAIETRVHPDPRDGWILIPADHPLLSPTTLSRLFERWNRTASTILVPTYQGKRGHPTLLRWEVRHLIPQIPDESGLNWILRHSGVPVTELEVEDSLILRDLDTPEDYQMLLREELPRMDEISRS